MKTYLLAPLLLAAAFQSRADVIVNITSLPTVQLNGQYEGFAGGIVNNKDAVSLLCDDINHETFVPSGNLQYKVSTVHDLSAVRFSGPNALHNYREAALLIMGDGTSALPGIMNVSDPTLIASYQYALWDLFAPSAPGFGSSAALGAQASLSALRLVRSPPSKKRWQLCLGCRNPVLWCYSALLCSELSPSSGANPPSSPSSPGFL